MSKHKISYSDFVDDLDIDAVEAALGWEPVEHKNGEDIGYCLDLWGMHKHGDTTGKFAINREKKVYHCFVCGGGTLLSLVMEAEQMDEEDATYWLRQHAHGDKRTDDEIYNRFREALRTVPPEEDRMPHFNVHVLDQFDDKYLMWYQDRGIAEEVQKRYGVQYAENHKKHAPLRAGEKIDKDYFGPCIVFPHYWEGRLVGWQHRWLDWTEKHTLTPKWLPKYTNTSDFPKGTVYGYDEAIRDPGEVIIVESVPTCLMLRSLGLNSVATFGSEVNAKQMYWLRKLRQGIIIAPDNDEPGRKFARGAREYLRRYTNVTVLKPVTLKEGADLGDYMDADDPVAAVFDHLEEGLIGHDNLRLRGE